MSLDDIPGQETAARLIRAALGSGRLPHAFLFLGSAGTGRLAMAHELARILLCGDSPQPDAACGACRNCRLLAAGTHPDYRQETVPEGKQLVPIRAVRDMQRAAALKPAIAARRVFVVCDAERLTIEAANCFLKTLEEPPGACVFVLIASTLRPIPETVISRCRLVRFRNLKPEALAARLEAADMPPDDAHWLARRAWGSPGLAERLRQAELHSLNRELVERLRTISIEGNFSLSDWLDGLARQGGGSAAESRIRLQELLECALLYYRDLAVAAADPEGGPVLCNRAARDAIRQTAAGAEPGRFLEEADLVLDVIEAVGSNANRRLALDHLFTELGRRGPGAG